MRRNIHCILFAVVPCLLIAPTVEAASEEPSGAVGNECSSAVQKTRVLCVTLSGEELVVSAATIGDWAEQFELVGNRINYYSSHRVTLYRDGNMYKVNVCCPKGRAVILHEGDVLTIHKAAIERRRCAGEENGHAECDEPRLVASLYDREYWLAKKHRYHSNAEYMSLLSEEDYYFQIEVYEDRKRHFREKTAGPSCSDGEKETPGGADADS